MLLINPIIACMYDNDFLFLSKEQQDLLFILQVILPTQEDLEAQIHFPVATACYQKQVYNRKNFTIIMWFHQAIEILCVEF
jgi:hypothetical protein